MSGFFGSEISPTNLASKLRGMHQSQSGSKVTIEDEVRLQRSVEFLLGHSGDDQFIITEKPATQGCEEAAKYRFDLNENKFGVSVDHEVKSLLYISKDGKILYYFLMPGDKKLPSDVNDFAAPLSEDEMSKYDLIPYTVNPATFLRALKAKEELGLQVEIHIDSGLYERKLGFVTNNCGSRYISCSMTVPHFAEALDRELQEVKDKYDDQVHVLFHQDLSSFVYKGDRRAPNNSIFPKEAAQAYQQFINGDHCYK